MTQLINTPTELGFCETHNLMFDYSEFQDCPDCLEDKRIHEANRLRKIASNEMEIDLFGGNENYD